MLRAAAHIRDAFSDIFFLDRQSTCLREYAHTFSFVQQLSHQLADIFVFVWQDTARDIAQIYLCTKSGHQLCNFYPHAAATNNVEAFGRANAFKHRARRQIIDRIKPLNIRQLPLRTGRNQKVLGRNMAAINANFVRRQKVRSTLKRINAFIGIITAITPGARTFDGQIFPGANAWVIVTNRACT